MLSSNPPFSLKFQHHHTQLLEIVFERFHPSLKHHSLFILTTSTHLQTISTNINHPVAILSSLSSSRCPHCLVPRDLVVHVVCVRALEKPRRFRSDRYRRSDRNGPDLSEEDRRGPKGAEGDRRGPKGAERRLPRLESIGGDAALPAFFLRYFCSGKPRAGSVPGQVTTGHDRSRSRVPGRPASTELRPQARPGRVRPRQAKARQNTLSLEVSC